MEVLIPLFLISFKSNCLKHVFNDWVRNYFALPYFFVQIDFHNFWIENENWNYKTSFVISKSEIKHNNIDLQFDGLDTYATVFLNGKQILEANNMFTTWKIPVKNYIVEGENHLEIKFKSAVQEGKNQANVILSKPNY